ncbi:MAG: GNAT family N-acetyltransferase, partial [Candidatus Limnocylindrus sp.]
LSSDSAPGAFLIGTVHPAHQGIGLGRAIFTWSRERARVLLADHPTGAMFVHLPDCDAPARRLVESQGGTPIRFYSDMLLHFSDRPIAESLEHLSAPAGYEVLSMDRVDGELLRQLRNHCFADHWGSWEMSPESWRDLLREDSARPSCSEVVIDRHGALVAMQMTSEFPQDAATVGRVRWVGQLGVHRDHRRRGLASLLIERHLVTAKRDGLEGSMLGVDAASLTGANTLYESLGYRRTGGGIRYSIS